MNKVFGIIGLGKMGANLTVQATDKGYTVIGYDLHLNAELQKRNIRQVPTVEQLIIELPQPRVLILLIPAGKAVDTVIDEILPSLTDGDVIVDCGNSYWGDSIRRHERVSAKGIHFVDCGTSGGVEGARNGACFMLGGDDVAIEIVAPIFKDLCVPGGYVHAGKPGSGHFVKLVHNGVEFGMLQAIGEGMSLLNGYQDELNLVNILRCWENGSVIRSWLIELMRKQLETKGGFDNTPSYVEDTGEVNWLVTDAMSMEVPVPVIAASIMQLIASRANNNISAKAIAMMRNGFGGHPFGPDNAIQHERMHGQVQGFYRPDDSK